MKYLDVGHNSYMKDISFVSFMPDLEVAIIAINDVDDISPLAGCTKLEYLELEQTKFTDASPLANLVNLEHLNIVQNWYLEDITPLYNLKKLKRFWIGYQVPVPAEQIEKMKELLPDCDICTAATDSMDGDWRWDYTRESGFSERYELLRQQFGYEYKDFALSWNDPLYEPHD